MAGEEAAYAGDAGSGAEERAKQEQLQPYPEEHDILSGGGSGGRRAGSCAGASGIANQRRIHDEYPAGRRYRRCGQQ